MRVGHEFLHTYLSSVLDIHMKLRKHWEEGEFKEFLTSGGNENYYLYMGSLQGAPGIPKERTSKHVFASRTFLLNFIY